MKVGLAQIRPTLGRVDRNVDLHMQMIERVRNEDVDLLVFPELSLTGYHLLDLTYDVARTLDSSEIQTLVEASVDIDLIFGFVEHSPEHILYNSAIYASGGQIVSVHRKVYLPTYGMFDEARFFGKGERLRAFDTRFGRIGMLICEDMWHPSAPYLIAQDRADILVVLANSPARGIHPSGLGTQDSWSSILTSQAQFYGMFLLFAHRVGTEDGITFFGDSSVVNPLGEIENKGKLFEEDLVVTELDLDQIKRARFATPILRDEDTDLTIRELTRIQQQRRGGERL